MCRHCTSRCNMRQIAVITNYSDDSYNYGSSFEEYRLVLRKPYNKTCSLGSRYKHLTAYLFKAAQDPRAYFLYFVFSCFSYYREHSFNVKPKFECFKALRLRRLPSRYNNEADCKANGGTWSEMYNYLEKAPGNSQRNSGFACAARHPQMSPSVWTLNVLSFRNQRMRNWFKTGFWKRNAKITLKLQ